MKERYRRIIAIFFALNILFEVISPTVALALTGGPSQPEVQAFTPVGTSDMVNLFSGDFNYNIPLMDVDGYPVNLAYNAGISNDQEASWVGLGWNINPGTVNRGMRGLPDEFNGTDVVKKEMSMKPNQTFGVNFGLGFELFGKGVKKESGNGFGNLNLSLGLNYNTYTGYGMDMGAKISLSQTKNNASGFNGSLGLNSGTGKGLGISADVGYQKAVTEKGEGNKSTTNRRNASLGLNYNTVSGLNSLSFNYSATRQKGNIVGQDKNGDDIVDYSGKGNYNKSGNGGFGYSFADPSYMPSSGPEMINLGLSLGVTFGAELFGTHPKVTIGAYYSGQFIKDKTKDYKAYGYFHSDKANCQGNPDNSRDILHDFNREKDASFTLNTPNLPVTNYSYDSYNYTGQGISGDFRPHRNHVGTVFDPLVKNFPSISANVGIELGVGNTAHTGVNVDLVFSRTKTGKWSDQNLAESKATFKGGNGGFNESVYFKQGGEKTAETDMNYFNNVINGFTPVRFNLQPAGASAFCTNVLTTKYGATKVLNTNNRASRVRRNESVNVLTGAQASIAGLETSIKNYPTNDFQSFYSTNGQPVSMSRTSGTYLSSHHISEITTLRDDGARYVYGIPAYNNKTEEAIFAVEPSNSSINYNTGLVPYSAGSDNSTNNSKGLDNYFSGDKMPGYPHSFLLTAVLSSDYVDKTQNGPSKDDLGKYTKFNYSRVHADYKWRTPYTQNEASLNQGMYSATGPSGDDKASYSYGEKEVWYMHSIETKNYVAVFELEDRDDGLGVLGKDGGMNTSQKLKRLKEIRLFTKQELIDKGASAVPLKTVHFEYDYSLCANIENNIVPGNGKLTLKKVWFTYQNSQKGKLSPYKFDYASAPNFGYSPKAYDRWGNYKPNNPASGFNPNSNDPNLLSSEFPYAEQDQTAADLYASAWNLSKITLPSGAEINVTYEADDYAYVQDKKAMLMHTIIGASDQVSTASPTDKLYDMSSLTRTNYNHIYVKLSPKEIADINAVIAASQSVPDYIRNRYFRNENGTDIDYLYFKFLVNVERNLGPYNKKFEYISGYAKIDWTFPPAFENGNSIRFTFKEVDVFDNIPLSGQKANPVSMAGINYVRKYMPRVAYDNNQDPFSSFGSNMLALAQGIKSAFTPIVQFFKGGMANALLLSQASQQFAPERSFVRLYSPDQFKKGGGARVKQLVLSDNWASQSGNPSSTNSTYGQIYDYVTKDAGGRVISSGVASYEPLIGGDENPFRKPIFYEEKHILAPDDDFYHEEPYGESMFPGPSIGYSRVVVRNLERKQGSQFVSRHATGATVHEFYTAKDFPTKTDRTDLKKERHKPNPVAKFLKFFVRDFMTTSQGYQVILNDMHGKQKAQWVYKEADPNFLTDPNKKAIDAYYGNNYISGIEYKYKRNLDQLVNNCEVIEKNGQISVGQVGVDYDMVVDTRESQTITRNGTTQGNLEGFLVSIFPALVPSIWPGYSQEKIRYRSSVVTKVLYRYGLLDETIAYDNGASVSTKNKLYDAETGEILLTETVNNFSDPIYSLTYPAHWAYDRMGSSSKNIAASSSISGGSVSSPGILALGDEVLLSSGAYGWVKSTSPVQIVNASGIVLGLGSESFLTIIRSGYRNQQNLPIAKVNSLVNPLVATGSSTNLVLNNTTKVVNTSAAEFKDDWGIFCNCGITATTVVNPYLTGQKGIWRPASSYVYLTGRDQSKKNDNTNIRKDGPYLTYVPFWTPNTTSTPYNWTKTADPAWQFTSKMTAYSQYGFEIENMDALGRSSAALYGYGNSLPIAVSSNSKYSQIGFDGFEDYDYNNPCEDDHFSFIQYNNGSSIVTYDKTLNNYISKPSSQNQKYAHTGRKSIKVAPGATVQATYTTQASCSPNPPQVFNKYN